MSGSIIIFINRSEIPDKSAASAKGPSIQPIIGNGLPSFLRKSSTPFILSRVRSHSYTSGTCNASTSSIEKINFSHFGEFSPSKITLAPKAEASRHGSEITLTAS